LEDLLDVFAFHVCEPTGLDGFENLFGVSETHFVPVYAALADAGLQDAEFGDKAGEGAR
jgi:hypothetical protein